MRIASLTGDREFIDHGSMNALAERKIPFVLRPRENQYLRREGYVEMTVAAIAARLRTCETLILKQSCKLGRAADAPGLRVVI